MADNKRPSGRRNRRGGRSSGSSGTSAPKTLTLEEQIAKEMGTKPNLQPVPKRPIKEIRPVGLNETKMQADVRKAGESQAYKRELKAWKQEVDSIKADNDVIKSAHKREVRDRVQKLRKAEYDKLETRAQKKADWESKTPRQQARAKKASQKKAARTKARNARIKTKVAKKKAKKAGKKPGASKQTYRKGGIDTKNIEEYDAEVKKQKALGKEGKWVNHPDAKANTAVNKAAKRSPVRKAASAIKGTPGKIAKVIKPIAKVAGKAASVPGLDLALATLDKRTPYTENPEREPFTTVRDRDGVAAALWDTAGDYTEELFDPRTNDSWNPLEWDLFSDNAKRAAQDFGLGGANTMKDLYYAATGDNTREHLSNIAKRSIPKDIREALSISDPTGRGDLGYMEDAKNQADVQNMAAAMDHPDGGLTDEALELLALPPEEMKRQVIAQRTAEEKAALAYASTGHQNLYKTAGEKGDTDFQREILQKMRSRYREGMATRDAARDKNADISMSPAGYERQQGGYAGPEATEPELQRDAEDELRRANHMLRYNPEVQKMGPGLPILQAMEEAPTKNLNDYFYGAAKAVPQGAIQNARIGYGLDAPPVGPMSPVASVPEQNVFQGAPDQGILERAWRQGSMAPPSGPFSPINAPVVPPTAPVGATPTAPTAPMGGSPTPGPVASPAEREATAAKVQQQVAMEEGAKKAMAMQAARNSYYKSRLNPFGAGSGYEEFYRRPNQGFIGRQE